MGRKPLAEGEGRPNGRPKAPTVGTIQPGVPDCPEHLSEGAKDEWRRIAQKLADLNVLTPLDAATLAIYCDSYDRWLRAVQGANAGDLVEESRGAMVPNAYLAVAKVAAEQCRAALSELGLSPSSRAKVGIKVVPVKGETGFEAVLETLLRGGDVGYEADAEAHSAAA